MIAAAAAWLKNGLILSFCKSGLEACCWLNGDSHHLLKNSFRLWLCLYLYCVCVAFICFTLCVYGVFPACFKASASDNKQEILKLEAKFLMQSVLFLGLDKMLTYVTFSLFKYYHYRQNSLLMMIDCQ